MARGPSLHDSTQTPPAMVQPRPCRSWVINQEQI